MPMMRNWECDCGCGKKVEDAKSPGWFELDQRTEVGKSLPNLAPKLTNTLTFFSLECLQRWVILATQELPKLQSTAQHLHPRGNVISNNVQGLYV